MNSQPETEADKAARLDKLLHYSLIVSMYGGFISLKEENLKMILEAGNCNYFSKESPVAFVACIGPKNSGKTLLTNVMLQYLKHGEEGGWMTEVIKRTSNHEHMMEGGFAWNSVMASQTYFPMEISGVYMWPEAFQIKNGDKRTNVWILYLHLRQEDKIHGHYLETFLALVATRIAEIVGNNKSVQLLDQHVSISEENKNAPVDLEVDEPCKNAVFVLRSEKKSVKEVSGNRVKEEILKLIENSELKYRYETCLAQMDSVSLVWFQDSNKPLHNETGLLYLDVLKQKQKEIKNIVETILCETEIQPKTNHAVAITLETMFDFFKRATQKVLSMQAKNLKRQTGTKLLNAKMAEFPEKRSEHHILTDMEIDPIVDTTGSAADPEQNLERMAEDQTDDLSLSLTRLTLDDIQTQANKHDQTLVKTGGDIGRNGFGQAIVKSTVEDMEHLQNEIKTTYVKTETYNYWSKVALPENEKRMQLKREQGLQQRREEEEQNTREKQERQQKDHVKAKESSTPKVVRKPVLITKDELQPLVFHLQAAKITMAMNMDGKAIVLKNEFDEEHTPACVAYTVDNNFIYGSKVITTANTLNVPKFSFSLADFFLNKEIDEHMYMNVASNEHQIKVEFLIGYLLMKMKHAVEHQLDGCCNIAVLVIPFWLSSTQRIQIKDAAFIAGFPESYLINEPSAAAYNFAVSGERESGELLVLCESFDRVDAMVYTYQTHNQQIRMLAHESNCEVGSYHYNPLKTFGHIMASGLQQISNGVNYIMNALTPGAPASIKDKSDNPHESYYVFKAAKHTVSNAEKSMSGLQIREYLFCCENWNKWGNTLQTVGDAYGKKAVKINESEAVINGAVYLAGRPNEIAKCVRDMPAFDIMKMESNGHMVNAFRKTDQLPFKVGSFSTTHSKGVKEAKFCQNASKIANINVPDVEQNQCMNIKMEITSEAIVRFGQVKLSSASYNNRNSDFHVLEDRIQLDTPNLSEQDKVKLMSLLHYLAEPPVAKQDDALLKAKSDLREVCEDIRGKIKSGEIRFKSKLGETAAAQQILDAENYATHKNSTIDSIELQLVAIEKLRQKLLRKKGETSKTGTLV